MRDKCAYDVMVPLERVFRLNIDARLDAATMRRIIDSHHSRIPLVDERGQMRGCLLVKALIQLSPSDSLPVRALMKTRAYRSLPHVARTRGLFDLMQEFKSGRDHMAVVHECSAKWQTESDDDDDCEAMPQLGIVTLEDVVDELIREEIAEEMDRREMEATNGQAAGALRVSNVCLEALNSITWLSAQRRISRRLTALPNSMSAAVAPFGERDPLLAEEDA